MISKCLECRHNNMCYTVMTLCEELEEPWYSELKYFEPIEIENNQEVHMMHDADEMFFEEDNLLTNFSDQDLPQYKKAVEIFNDDSLYIDEVAFDGFGRLLEGHHALRTNSNKDMSSFWRLFKSLK